MGSNSKSSISAMARSRKKTCSSMTSIIRARPTRSCSAHMEQRPASPLRSACFALGSDIPRYEDVVTEQIRDVQAKKGKGDLAKLLRAGDTWEVRA